MTYNVFRGTLNPVQSSTLVSDCAVFFMNVDGYSVMFRL